MKRVLIGLTVTSLLLTGCAEKSKYENEDAKLAEYSKQMLTELRYALYKNADNPATTFKEPFNAKEFAKVRPYVEAYKNDINIDKLSPSERLKYEDMLMAIRELDDLIDEADVSDMRFENEYYKQFYANDYELKALDLGMKEFDAGFPTFANKRGKPLEEFQEDKR